MSSHSIFGEWEQSRAGALCPGRKSRVLALVSRASGLGGGQALHVLMDTHW